MTKKGWSVIVFARKEGKLWMRAFKKMQKGGVRNDGRDQ
jgi:hypothetical protein